jgi:hypothetical protein
VVLALIGVRLLAKIAGRGAGQCGQRRQLAPGAVGGLRHDAHVVHGAAAGLAVRAGLARPPAPDCRVALPAILLMEVLGAVIATVAIYRAGESSKPWLGGAPGAPADRATAPETAVAS